MSHINTHALTKSVAAIGAVVACAVGAPANLAHARMFEIAPSDTMIQRPLPSQWWCAENRALLDRNVPCAAAAPAADFRVPGPYEKETR